MNGDDFLKLIREEPFKPFRVLMKDGQSYDVIHPRLTLVMKSYVRIGIPALDEVEPVADTSVKCPYANILRTEPIRN